MTSKPIRRRTEPAQSGPIGPEIERALRVAAHGGGLGRGIGLARVAAPDPEPAESLFRHLPIPAYAMDAESHRIIAVNDAALSFYGHTRDAFMGLTLLDLRPAREHARWSGQAFADSGPLAAQPSIHLAANGRERAGSTQWVRMSYQGRPAVLMIVSEAVQPEPIVASGPAPATGGPRAAEPSSMQRASTVGAARLPDRDQFRATVVAALSGGARYGEQAAMLCLEIDGVAAVEDALGRDAGDLVRGQVGDRLRAILRGHDMVAQMGDDLFAVLQTSVESPASASALARLIIDEVAAPYEVGDRRVRLGLSVGIARAPEDGSDPDTLLRNADMALGRAKTAGRGAVRFFDPCMTRARQIPADA